MSMMMKKFALTLAVALAVPVQSLAPPPVDAASPAPTTTWGPVRKLAPRGTAPDVAVDALGVTTVVWGTTWPAGPIRAVRRSADGRWGHPVTLGRGADPQVAVDARGNVTAIWTQFRRHVTEGLMAARRPSGGHWTAPVRLSHDRPAAGYGDDEEGTYGVGKPVLAVSAGGAVVVAWEWGSYDRDVPFRIQSVFRPAGARWQDLVRLTGADWSEEASVAIDARGNAVVAYGHEDGALLARRRVVGRGWKAPVVVAKRAEHWRVASDRSGNTVVAFSRYTASAAVVRAVRRPAAGPWGIARTISPAGTRAIWPEVVVDGAGAITVAWERWAGGVAAVRRPAGGPWGTAVQVAPIGQPADEVGLAVNPAGDVLLTWLDESVFGVYRRHGGSWTSPFRVTPVAHGFVFDLATAVSPGGAGVATWETSAHPSPVWFRRMSKW